MALSTSPIIMDCKPANNAAGSLTNSITTFNSYSFDRSILTPASAFRFTAPGVDLAARQAIRSGDMVALYIVNSNNQKFPLATGFIDQTDTHVVPQNVEYVLTGRDTLGQLVDNAVVDASNKIINTKNITLMNFLNQLVANTRIPVGLINQQVPNGQLLINTSPGETKINALQRYLGFMNCLVWTNASGQIIVGKPNFSQGISGSLMLNSTANPLANNCLEARIRRDTNTAIRQIVTQLQSLDQVDAGTFTVLNNDVDVKKVAPYKVGRSVYERFSYGSGNDAVNQVQQVGNQTGSPQAIGAALSRREIARDNVKVLDVEIVVREHFNENGQPYNIDQIYDVQLADDTVNEPMYVYACSYELTVEHGALTRLRLCRVGTSLVDGAGILPRTVVSDNGQILSGLA